MLLEKQLNRRFLHFACRHHVYELIAIKVTEVCWPSTSGPDMAVFKRFEDQWKNINKEEYDIGSEDDLIAGMLEGTREDIVDFITRRFEVLSLL